MKKHIPHANQKLSTIFPSKGKALVLEKKYNCQIYPMSLALLYFRADSTYTFGYCSCQVNEAGRYSNFGDSVYFYDRIEFSEKNSLPNMFMPYDKKTSTLYKKYTLDSSDITGKYNMGLLSLKLNLFDNHAGFLRNEDMSLDSLVAYNELWPWITKQKDWFDSVQKLNVKIGK